MRATDSSRRTNPGWVFCLTIFPTSTTGSQGPPGLLLFIMITLARKIVANTVILRIIDYFPGHGEGAVRSCVPAGVRSKR
jgi:hypothetical protein